MKKSAPVLSLPQCIRFRNEDWIIQISVTKKVFVSLAQEKEGKKKRKKKSRN